MPELTTEDVTLFYEVDGDGEPVSVLAHGLTNNRNELAAFTPFVPGTKVRLDLRGHGRSTAPPAVSFAFADFAGDVDAVARHVGATVAVGTSLGAGALGNLVSRVPDRFDRMVWLLPAGLDLPFPLAGRYRDLARSFDGLTSQEMLERVAGGSRDVETPWRLQVDRLLWEHDDPSGLARAVRGVVDDHPIPDRELLRRVEIPTLILTIGGDEIHPAVLGEIYADLLPNAELLAFASRQDLFADLASVLARVSAFIAGTA
ncbi:MAG TPA: alpha/beta hydrolase [Actinomycetota bacterium]|nr:alpha/beta hydrolase [Actinomycetota bacterium]